jgi:hypothetical protein
VFRLPPARVAKQGPFFKEGAMSRRVLVVEERASTTEVLAKSARAQGFTVERTVWNAALWLAEQP